MATIKSIKEKAKAYDKAIEELRGLLEGIHEDKCDIMEEDIIKIFPELKDSEDERMWKLIKKYAHYNISDMALEADHITREQLETWLEKQGEQKPAWSDEDERIFDEAIYFIRREPYRECDAEPIVDWLKSLKDRVQPQKQWKPSDEQMKFLWKYAEQNNYDGSILTSLYNDLKKLREEDV